MGDGSGKADGPRDGKATGMHSWYGLPETAGLPVVDQKAMPAYAPAEYA